MCKEGQRVMESVVVGDGGREGSPQKQRRVMECVVSGDGEWLVVTRIGC